ncbi:hypothetical protein [Longimicrobium sp.]|uniref:hypothetical protein n=1 Tax=Longimicrobium sp. TaxID=2029185 RepID=UPI002E301DFA|nr:hypothetical protein [Longimicrobium sp.]HEX6038356.1 hypothetical protein [Longimicrobium sp.]
MQTWRTRLALAAGAAVLAGACGTAETHLVAPETARHGRGPAPEDVQAPRQVVPPPPDTGRDDRWGGFIGGGGR